MVRGLPISMIRQLTERREDAGSAPVVVPAGRDGPDNVLVPDCPEQWPLVAAGIPQPDYLFPCQETSGNLVDVCNSPGGVLTAAANVLYNQSVAGWSRKFVGVSTEATGSGFHAPVSSLWNIGNQSLFRLIYVAIIASNGPTRCVMLQGGANGVHVQAPTAGQLANFCTTSTVGTFVYENVTATVYPVVQIYDRRGVGLSRLNTNKEQVTGTWANFSDNNKGIGSPVGLAAPVLRLCLDVTWVGTDAETMADRGGAGNGGRQAIADLGWPMAY